MFAILVPIDVVGPSCSPFGAPTGSSSLTEQACPRSSFSFREIPATGLLPSASLRNGSYRTLRTGQTSTLLKSLSGSREDVSLSRGTDSSLFAVSAYAHGFVPLQPVVVLGSTFYLYPAQVDSQPGPRIPFRYPSGASNDPPCDRYQLQESELTTPPLQRWPRPSTQRVSNRARNNRPDRHSWGCQGSFLIFQGGSSTRIAARQGWATWWANS